MLECRGQVVAVMPRVFGETVSAVRDGDGVVVDVSGGGIEALSFDLSIADGQGVETLRVWPRTVQEMSGIGSMVAPRDVIATARELVGAQVAARVTVRAFSRKSGGAGFSLSAASLAIESAESRRAA